MYTSFDLLPRAWVPGGRSCVAWPHSPGLLGRLQGGAGALKSAPRSVASPLGFRIEIYLDFDVGLGSFWGRSWVPLGGHFRSSWRFIPLKWLPEPSSNRLIFEKVFVHEIVCFFNTLGVFGLPHGASKATKIAPRPVLDRLGSLHFDSRCSLRFWIVLGSGLGRFWT